MSPIAWNGYWEYDGEEIINAPRVETYLDAKGWFKPTIEMPGFSGLLERAPYLDPVTDVAPWYDPDLPASGEFLGFYPLDITGVEDSARISAPTEFTTDGGSAGRLRHGTKAVVFNGLLVADTERGAEYGMTWLRRVLLGARCSDRLTTSHSLGADLTYFSVAPDPSTADGTITPAEDFDIIASEALRAVLRQMKNVTINNGPTVMSKRQMSCNGWIWNVQFTAIVGNPYEYGVTHPILQGYLDPATVTPWVPGTVAGTASATPAAFVDVDCGEDVWEPLFDPLCPALVVPPAPPSVPLGCYVPPSTWDRYEVSLPGENVPLWTEMVPLLTVQAPTVEVRNVRVRFYADTTGTFDVSATPCDHIADMVLSYIPAGGTMIIDASTEQVFVVTSLGHRRRADSLVFASSGAPFKWPSLSCGVPHIVTIDLPTTEAEPVIDLALIPRSR